MEDNPQLEAVKAEHARLDELIHKEQSSIWKNCTLIEDLKKKKLAEKDKMLRMMHFHQ